MLLCVRVYVTRLIRSLNKKGHNSCHCRMKSDSLVCKFLVVLLVSVGLSSVYGRNTVNVLMTMTTDYSLAYKNCCFQNTGSGLW